jgi:flagellar basal-body rod protein FlgB
MTAPLSDVAVLSRLLDASALRHRVISQNIANVNTPGYRRQQVAFEEVLAGHVHDGDSAAALAVRPTVVPAEGGVTRSDGNGVTLEQEMMDLNKNTLLHNAAAQLLASQIATLRSAITGR